MERRFCTLKSASSCLKLDARLTRPGGLRNVSGHRPHTERTAPSSVAGVGALRHSRRPQTGHGAIRISTASRQRAARRRRSRDVPSVGVCDRLERRRAERGWQRVGCACLAPTSVSRCVRPRSTHAARAADDEGRQILCCRRAVQRSDANCAGDAARLLRSATIGRLAGGARRAQVHGRDRLVAQRRRQSPTSRGIRAVRQARRFATALQAKHHGVEALRRRPASLAVAVRRRSLHARRPHCTGGALPASRSMAARGNSVRQADARQQQIRAARGRRTARRASTRRNTVALACDAGVLSAAMHSGSIRSARTRSASGRAHSCATVSTPGLRMPLRSHHAALWRSSRPAIAPRPAARGTPPRRTRQCTLPRGRRRPLPSGYSSSAACADAAPLPDARPTRRISRRVSM